MASKLTATFVAAALVMSAGAAAANEVTVKVSGGANMRVVLYADGIDGRLLATTDARGNAVFDDDFVNAPKGQKMQMKVRKCPQGQQQVMLVAGSAGPAKPANCDDRNAGTMVFGETQTLNIGSVWSSGRTLAVTAATAATGLTLGAVSRQTQKVGIIESEEQLRNKPGGGTESGSGSGSGSGNKIDPPDPTSLNGTYTGNLSATNGGCNFLPNPLVIGTLKVDSSGRGTWEKTHVAANKTFRFSIELTMTGKDSGTFTGQTTDTVGSRTFTIVDTGTIENGKLTISQVFTSGNCVQRYDGMIPLTAK